MNSVRGDLVNAWNLLSHRSRRTLVVYGVSLVALAGLDAAALILVAGLFVGDTSAVSTDVSNVALMVGLFISRTILSTASSWWAVRSMTKEEIRIGSENFSLIMSSTVTSELTEVDLYNAVDRGPTSLTQGLAMYSVTILAEAATAIVILGTLLILDFATAVASSIYFLIVAYIQHQLLSRASARAGEIVTEETSAVYETLNDGFRLQKVLAAMPSRTFGTALDARRTRLATSRGRVAFLGTLPRYTMELVLSIGLIVVSGVAYVASGEDGTIRAVAIFGAAGFRLLPAINRIQGLILMMFSTLPAARLARLKIAEEDLVPTASPDSYPELTDDRVVLFDDVTYSYTRSDAPAVRNLSVSLERGLQYAIVGPSGAGKTTFLDLLLGLIKPVTGRVIKQTDLVVGYVPQDTHLARVGLEQNVALEWDPLLIDHERIASALSKASIESLADRFLDGTSDRMGDSVTSGGQRQRLGLARALYRSPNLLVLDEVTSALDAETEHFIMQRIRELRGNVTVVIVAHRLTTVQHADQVIYMDAGRVVGVGTFDQLRRSIPELQRQIELGTLQLSD